MGRIRARHLSGMLGLSTAVIMALSACGQPSASQTACNDAACASSRQTSGGPVVQLRRDTAWGDILVTNTGFTLYRFARDSPNTARCRDGCSDRWPPLLLLPNQRLIAGSGLRSSDLGLTAGPQGGRQLTYRRIPLYVYAMDQSPGDSNGEFVFDEGLWFVVTPSTVSPGQGPPAPTPTAATSAVRSSVS